MCATWLLFLFASIFADGTRETAVSIKEGLFLFQVEREQRSSDRWDARYLIYLNGRQIGVIDEPLVDLVGSYNLVTLNQKVVLLSAASGGNACPQKLVLIAFTKGGMISDKDVRLVLASSQFGNCHEDPIITANGSRVRIDFPWGRTPVAESWRYDGRRLVRTKAGR